MRVPASYFADVQRQEHLLRTATACSNRKNGRRSQGHHSDMSAGSITSKHPPANPSSPSPPPASVSEHASSPPPEVPNFLTDPVLNRTYARGRYLGKGGFAWCYEVTDVNTREIFALKVVSKKRIPKPRHRTKVLREINIHHPLHDKNVVRMYSAFEDENNIYMMLELCQLDSLVSVLKQRRALTEHEARYYLYQLLAGVHYLHDEARVLHRDLKLGNMLLTDRMEVKIGDFGLATEMEEDGCDHCGQVCGTPNYISPEVLRKEGHSRASEAWAIGCILYAMLVGKPPFETNTLEATYSLILACQYSYPPHVRLSPSSRNLIGLFLHPDPARRPSAVTALTHQFFAESIPMSLPQTSCYSAPNMAQLYSATTAPMENAVAGNFAVATHQIRRNPPSRVVLVPASVAAAYRTATPSEENTRFAGQEIKVTSVSRSGTLPLLANGHNVENHQACGGSGSSRYSSSSTSAGVSNGASAICPLDSLGNVAFGPEREAALTQWLHDVHQALTDVLYCSQLWPNDVLEGEAVKDGRVVYVTKWIDYSNRYGFACQLNNGAVSIMLNERTRICVSPDRRYCRLWFGHARSSSCVSASELVDLAQPRNVGQMEIVQNFIDYMDENLMTGGFSSTSSPVTLAVPFIVLWRRFSEHLLIVLSDGTFQINFINRHTKVILSPLVIPNQLKPEVGLTFIDQTRLARTCRLKNAIGTVVDGALLQRVRQLLADYVLSPSERFTAEI